MAKILVQKASVGQLRLSLTGRLERTDKRRSVPDVSGGLHDHAIREAHTLFYRVLRPVTFDVVAGALATAEVQETSLVSQEGRALVFKPLILQIDATHSPRAFVGLALNLRGPSKEIEEVYRILLSMMPMSLTLRRRLFAGSGRFSVTV